MCACRYSLLLYLAWVLFTLLLGFSEIVWYCVG
jgi:hypothetical protein